jgi:hypothetical protein
MPRKKGPLKERTLNFVIDDIVHPQIRKHPELKVVDVLLHFIVEGDPARSAKKTIRYDLPGLIDTLAQQRKTRKKDGSHR